MRHLLTIAAAALLASATAWAQDSPPNDLASARAIFRALDRNTSGKVSYGEAGRRKIAAQDFVAYDADRDRRWSEEEFLLYYRQLLGRANKDVAEDLEVESARILAVRRARREQTLTRPANGPEQPQKSPAAKPAVDDSAERAQASSQTTAKVEEARRALEQASVKESAPVKPEDTRIEPNTGAQPPPGRPAPAGDPPRSATERLLVRAQGILKRLTETGRITPEQGRDFYQLLVQRAKTVAQGDDGAGANEPPANAVALAESLGRSFQWVEEEAAKGGIEPEEAEVLSSSLIAGAWIGSGRSAPVPEPGRPRSIRQRYEAALRALLERAGETGADTATVRGIQEQWLEPEPRAEAQEIEDDGSAAPDGHAEAAPVAGTESQGGEGGAGEPATERPAPAPVEREPAKAPTRKPAPDPERTEEPDGASRDPRD